MQISPPQFAFLRAFLKRVSGVSLRLLARAILRHLSDF